MTAQLSPTADLATGAVPDVIAPAPARRDNAVPVVSVPSSSPAQQKAEPAGPHRRRRLIALIAATTVAATVGLQHHTLLAALGHLGRLPAGWLALAVAAEVVSFLALAELARCLLASGGVRLGRGNVVALTWASSAVSSSLPAGTVISAAYTYRQLTRRGATAGLASWVLLASGVLSGSALISLAVLGAQLHSVAGGCALVIAGASAGLIVASCSGAATLAWLSARPSRLDALAGMLTRGRSLLTRTLRRTAVSPRRGQTEQPRTFSQPIVLGPARWCTAMVMAALNWVADGTALALCLIAAGVVLPVRAIVLAYALSQLAVVLPLLPGAIGIAEGSMVVALVAAGARPQDALVATLAYRLVSFWLQLPVGWVAWATLRRGRDQVSPGQDGALVAV